MNKEIELKIKYYQDRINKGEFKLEMRFITSIFKMPMNELRTPFSDNINDYEVSYLNVNKVVSQLESDGEDRFPQDILIIDCHTVGLIEFIESGGEIIPPSIIFINNGCWKVMDGQHRISLMRYLKLEYAPFLIRERHLHYSKELK